MVASVMSTGLRKSLTHCTTDTGIRLPAPKRPCCHKIKVTVGLISKCGAAEAWVVVDMIAPIQNIGNLQIHHVVHKDF